MELTPVPSPTTAPKPLAPGVAEILAEAQPAASPPVPVPQFLSGKSRSMTIELEWPLAYDGLEYSAIMLKRLSTQEVADFIRSVAGRDESSRFTFPVFYRPDGVQVPEAVLDALDDDDMQKLNEVAEGFLPRRFQTALAGASIPLNGAFTGR